MGEDILKPYNLQTKTCSNSLTSEMDTWCTSYSYLNNRWPTRSKIYAGASVLIRNCKIHMGFNFRELLKTDFGKDIKDSVFHSHIQLSVPKNTHCVYVNEVADDMLSEHTKLQAMLVIWEISAHHRFSVIHYEPLKCHSSCCIIQHSKAACNPISGHMHWTILQLIHLYCHQISSGNGDTTLFSRHITYLIPGI